MTDVILRISGMDCGACAVRIVRALRGLPGLREVSVSDTVEENGVRYVVRASGTEQKIRFLTESADEFLAEESLKSVMKTVSEFVYDN